jgi:phage-related holin
MNRIVDKKFFLTEWKRSVPAMILVIIAVLLDRTLVVKWVIVAALIPLFGTSKELYLNETDQSIDEALTVLGIRITRKQIPIKRIWEFMIRQDQKNRYQLIAQMTSGEKIVLLREDLEKDILRHQMVLKEFVGV